MIWRLKAEVSRSYLGPITRMFLKISYKRLMDTKVSAISFSICIMWSLKYFIWSRGGSFVYSVKAWSLYLTIGSTSPLPSVYLKFNIIYNYCEHAKKIYFIQINSSMQHCWKFKSNLLHKLPQNQTK